MSDQLNVDLMRWIDRRAGAPLCALATLWLKLWWCLWPVPTRPLRRVLFIELSEMGRTILADPAMRSVRDRNGIELYFVIFARSAGSVALTNTIPPGNVFTINSGSLWRLIVDTLRFWAWTRRNAIDAVIDFELFSRFSGLLTGLSGANRRVGFYRFHGEGLYRGEMLTHRVVYNPHIHIAKNFIALADALMSDIPTVPYGKTKIEDARLNVALLTPTTAARNGMLTQIGMLAPNFDIGRHRLILVNPNPVRCCHCAVGCRSALPNSSGASWRPATIVRRDHGR